MDRSLSHRSTSTTPPPPISILGITSRESMGWTFTPEGARRVEETLSPTTGEIPSWEIPSSPESDSDNELGFHISQKSTTFPSTPASLSRSDSPFTASQLSEKEFIGSDYDSDGSDDSCATTVPYSASTCPSVGSLSMEDRTWTYEGPDVTGETTAKPNPWYIDGE